ncbi:hypothetical protein CHUAL_005512 [Chamberlinius hualienensis]
MMPRMKGGKRAGAGRKRLWNNHAERQAARGIYIGAQNVKKWVYIKERLGYMNDSDFAAFLLDLADSSVASKDGESGAQLMTDISPKSAVENAVEDIDDNVGVGAVATSNIDCEELENGEQTFNKVQFEDLHPNKSGNKEIRRNDEVVDEIDNEKDEEEAQESVKDSDVYFNEDEVRDNFAKKVVSVENVSTIESNATAETVVERIEKIDGQPVEDDNYSPSEDDKDMDWTPFGENLRFLRKSTRMASLKSKDAGRETRSQNKIDSTLSTKRKRLTANSIRKVPSNWQVASSIHSVESSASGQLSQSSNKHSKEKFRSCIYCYQKHMSGYCPLQRPVAVIIDAPVSPSLKGSGRRSIAEATMPKILKLVTIDSRHGPSVVAMEALQQYTQFGPLIGQPIDEANIHEDMDLKDIWELFNEEGKTYLTTADPSVSNWLRFLRPANSRNDRNLAAITKGDNLYFVTLKEVTAGTELLYWSEDPTISWSKKKMEKTCCGGCNQKFVHPFYYRMHCMIFHDPNYSLTIRKYHCKICGVAVLGKLNIMRHASEMHDGKGAYQCQYCKKFFLRLNYLDMHRTYGCKMNPKRTRPLCDLCGKKFCQPQKLKIHIRRMHSEMSDVLSEFQCKGCFKLLGSKAALQRHLKEVHQKDQNIAATCDRCGKTFQNKSNLKIHMLTHSGVKPFKCTENGCFAAFTTKQCLQFHYKKVHGYSADNIPTIERCISYTFESYSGGHSDAEFSPKEIDDTFGATTNPGIISPIDKEHNTLEPLDVLPLVHSRNSSTELDCLTLDHIPQSQVSDEPVTSCFSHSNNVSNKQAIDERHSSNVSPNSNTDNLKLVDEVCVDDNSIDKVNLDDPGFENDVDIGRIDSSEVELDSELDDNSMSDRSIELDQHHSREIPNVSSSLSIAQQQVPQQQTSSLDERENVLVENVSGMVDNHHHVSAAAMHAAAAIAASGIGMPYGPLSSRMIIKDDSKEFSNDMTSSMACDFAVIRHYAASLAQSDYNLHLRSHSVGGGGSNMPHDELDHHNQEHDLDIEASAEDLSGTFSRYELHRPTVSNIKVENDDAISNGMGDDLSEPPLDHDDAEGLMVDDDGELPTNREDPTLMMTSHEHMINQFVHHSTLPSLRGIDRLPMHSLDLSLPRTTAYLLEHLARTTSHLDHLGNGGGGNRGTSSPVDDIEDNMTRSSSHGNIGHIAQLSFHSGHLDSIQRPLPHRLDHMSHLPPPPSHGIDHLPRPSSQQELDQHLSPRMDPLSPPLPHGIDHITRSSTSHPLKSLSQPHSYMVDHLSRLPPPHSMDSYVVSSVDSLSRSSMHNTHNIDNIRSNTHGMDFLTSLSPRSGPHRLEAIARSFPYSMSDHTANTQSSTSYILPPPPHAGTSDLMSRNSPYSVQASAEAARETPLTLDLSTGRQCSIIGSPIDQQSSNENSRGVGQITPSNTPGPGITLSPDTPSQNYPECSPPTPTSSSSSSCQTGAATSQLSMPPTNGSNSSSSYPTYMNYF